MLVVVVVVIIIAASMGGNKDQNGDALPDNNGSAEPANKPTITLEEFNNLTTGMTYEEAVAVIGGEGTVSSESEIAGIKTSLYTWEGEGGLGANANAMFQGGKLIQKAQFGLK